MTKDKFRFPVHDIHCSFLTWMPSSPCYIFPKFKTNHYQCIEPEDIRSAVPSIHGTLFDFFTLIFPGAVAMRLTMGTHGRVGGSGHKKGEAKNIAIVWSK